MDSNASPQTLGALPAWKRALDILCCLLAFPLLAVIALWTLIVTQIAAPGPIFFRQERVGYRGRRFFLYKFRTMHVSANVAQHQAHLARLMKSNAPMEKLDARCDSRLIPGAWLLRSSGLDELPQIINVFLGEMSIVGPRPCIPYEYEQYSPRHCRRLDSVPGLTGLWQVSGKNRTTFEEMVRLDIAYGEKLSLGHDLAIILRTLPALWSQISDTRRARCSTAQLSAPKILPAAATDLSRDSVTYLANSQNVVNGSSTDSPYFSPLATRMAMMSYHPSKSSAVNTPRSEHSGPQR